MSKTDQSEQVPQGTIVIRYISKQDILDILAYEKRTGYRFNRMPRRQFIADLGAEELLQVQDALVHNGVEIRCHALRPNGEGVFIDMPFDTFLGLASRSWNWLEVQPPPAWVFEYKAAKAGIGGRRPKAA